MARQERKAPIRPRTALLAAMATALAVLTALVVTGATPALAATKAAGDCTPYLAVVPGTLEPVEVYDVTWAGSSSGWSPPGSLRITATAYEDGAAIGSVTGTGSGTSVTTPVGGPVAASAGAIFSVKVTAYGPAGKVTCAAERAASPSEPAAADDEPTGSGDSTGSKTSNGTEPLTDTWTGLGLGLVNTSTIGQEAARTPPYLAFTP